MPALTVCPAKPTKLSAPARPDIRQNLSALTPELFGRALRLSRSRAAAEDLVQDTVERAIRFEAQYRAGSNLRAWVYQILFSVFATGCRRYRRERNALQVLSTDPCAWTMLERGADIPGLSPEVARALHAVPRLYRHAMILVDIKEFTYKEVARRLRVPLGTVMSRIHRGRRALADAVLAEQARSAAWIPGMRIKAAASRRSAAPQRPARRLSLPGAC
jgi:RNA polymerase sigma-70 factor (ECF subfamily)